MLIFFVFVDVIDLFYVFYILGIIGKFKGVVWDNGGYVVVFYYLMGVIYGISEDDIFWVVLDVGWVVGYLYIVYGLFIKGVMMVLYEGKFIGIFDVGVFWCMIEFYKVNVFFVVLIVFRVIWKVDFDVEFLFKYNMLSLCILFMVGECLDLLIYFWVSEKVGVFVIDYWW